jgi:AraC-like DNA-binding protein
LNFNLFNSLILVGVIQGFVFALIWLFSKKYRSKSTYYLVALILVYSLSNFQFYLLDIGVFDTVTFYDLYHVPYSLLMPAFMLLYGLSLIHGEVKINFKKRALFFPFLVIIILGLYYKYQLVIAQKPRGYSQFLETMHIWGEFIAIVYSLIIILVLLFEINRAKKKFHFSLTEIPPRLNWFKVLMIFNLFAILFWAYSEAAFYNESENYYYYPLWIIVSIIIYWIGHGGIYKYGIAKEREQIRKKVAEKYSIAEVTTSKNDLISSFEKFLITEGNFLNPQLTLDLVANELNVSSGHLSKTINTELQQSFKDYVNSLRVEKAKSFLSNPDFSNYTLVAIGLEAGFNSKSAFNASFKKITGFTPSEFKNEHIR